MARLPKPASAKVFNSYKSKNDRKSLEIVNTNLPVAAPQPASVPQSSVIFGFLKDYNVYMLNYFELCNYVLHV